MVYTEREVCYESMFTAVSERGCTEALNTANEFTCSMFDDHLRAFIDDELPVNIRALFTDHASKCAACAKKLRDMENVCSQLAHLPRMTVTPEFDFAVKLCIRREHENLQKPLYSFMMAIRENSSRLIMIPAAAIVLIVAAVFYRNMPAVPVDAGLPAEVVMQLQNGTSVDLVPDAGSEVIDEVHYVLEKASPGDLERGLILSGRSGATSPQDYLLISF